jgi:nicotinamidase-related amidase
MAPVELKELVADGKAAVLTMEIQRGVVGDLSSFPELAEAVAKQGVLQNTARLLRAARARGVPVVHCTAGFRADRLGSPLSAPLITSLLRRPSHLLESSAATELVPELERSDRDLVSYRSHGVSPFTGTALDPTLRALGVSTVIATGVSLNLGVIGLAIEAVNLGYHVVVPTDAVAGVPEDYAAAVLANTLRLVARLCTVDEVVGALGE